MSVYYSLMRWLEELKREGNNITYNINPPKDGVHEIVVVLMLKDTLRYALNLKQQWVIKKLLAWPNISSPLTSNDMIFDQSIDKIIVPSGRIANYFKRISPNSIDKIVIWYAWVKQVSLKSTVKKVDFLIYKKHCPEDVLNSIIMILNKQGITYELLEYGTFTHEYYLWKLHNSQWMIYLQESETQWLALQEARMLDVPTLVWNIWYCRSAKSKLPFALIYDEKISAPYLNDETGMFFYSVWEFEYKLMLFIKKMHMNLFSPRKYCLSHLSDIITTKNFLALLD